MPDMLQGDKEAFGGAALAAYIAESYRSSQSPRTHLTEVHAQPAIRNTSTTYAKYPCR